MMPELEIPSCGGEPVLMNLKPGVPAFVVGPNGSGKSALLHHLVSGGILQDPVYISAHRQTWMMSSASNLTPSNRRQQRQETTRWDQRLEARWRDDYGNAKIDNIFFDLIAAENQRARAIAKRMDEGDEEGAMELSQQQQAPLDRLNRIFSAGQLSVRIESAADEEILAVRDDPAISYGIAETSDGERAAMLLVSQVLLAKAGQTILVDEPERHLHRAITIPLLSALIRERSDCTWLISTHELSLPVAFPDSQSLLLRDIKWDGQHPACWSVDIFSAGDAWPEDLYRDILGAQQTIVFVEGKVDGTDHQLYSAIIANKDISIIPKGNNEEVQRATIGLRSVSKLHEIRALGLTDSDGRSVEEIESLRTKGVFVLDAWSLESLYYDQQVLQAVITKQVEVSGGDTEEILNNIQEILLRFFQDPPTRDQMINRYIHRSVQRAFHAKISSANSFSKFKGEQLCIPVERDDAERAYDSLVEQENIQELVRQYPMKNTDALGRVCKAIELSGKQYKNAVVTQIQANQSLRDHLRMRLGGLWQAL